MHERNTKMKTRYDDIRRRCQEFHAQHPEVWDLFVQFTFDRIERGFGHYSSDAIFHRIRWERAQPKYEKGQEFKLNDHYTAFYARAFMSKYPDHEGFFQLRRQTSKGGYVTHSQPFAPQSVNQVT